jgi:hypothetical protein
MIDRGVVRAERRPQIAGAGQRDDAELALRQEAMHRAARIDPARAAVDDYDGRTAAALFQFDITGGGLHDRCAHPGIMSHGDGLGRHECRSPRAQAGEVGGE